MLKTIILKRVAKLPGYTIGHMYLCNVKFCDTLEDTVRDVKIKHVTAIPAGTYPIKLTYSPKFKRVMPLIQHVPNFTGIRIHPGNTAKDTSGCIIVGENKLKGMVLNSKKTYDRLMERLQEGIENGHTWQITILSLAILLMVGCSSTKYIDREIPVTIMQRDTVILTDTLIQTKLDVVRDSVTVDAQYSYLVNKYAYSYAQIGTDGLLHHSLATIPTANVTTSVSLPYKIRYIEKEVPIKIPFEVYRQTWWQKTKGYGFYFLLVVFLIFYLVKRII